jgi:hypothetical protein
MNIWLSLFFSLSLTTFVSFVTPVIFCTFILSSLGIASHFPLINPWVENFYEEIWNFLAIFGEGSSIIGILTIAKTFAIVGFLFESLNFYRYHILIKEPETYSWSQDKVSIRDENLIITPPPKLEYFRYTNKTLSIKIINFVLIICGSNFC